MSLTTAQLAALKADIIAASDAECVALEADPTHPDKAFAVAALYNLAASPNWTIWKKSVSIAEVGNGFNAAEVAGLSTINNTRLQTMAQYSGGAVNPSLLDRRQFFDDVFSGAGGATTRASLLALWKRLASRAEKLFSTGTGSDASPATVAANIPNVFLLSVTEVLQAMQT